MGLFPSHTPPFIFLTPVLLPSPFRSLGFAALCPSEQESAAAHRSFFSFVLSLPPPLSYCRESCTLSPLPPPGQHPWENSQVCFFAPPPQSLHDRQSKFCCTSGWGKCWFSSSPQSHQGLWPHLVFTALGLQKRPSCPLAFPNGSGFAV